MSICTNNGRQIRHNAKNAGRRAGGAAFQCQKRAFAPRPRAGGEGEGMNRHYTFAQYRAIDLAIWAVLLAIFEYLLVISARFWFADQLYTVSLAAALTAIVYMRWGVWGAFHAVEAGAVFCYFSGGTPRQYLIYCAGNLLSLAALAVFRLRDKETVRAKAFWAVGFALAVQLLMQAGRALAALALGTSPGAAAAFFTTDSLSLLFTGVIVWIARRLDGVYEDQKHYLLRVQAQEEHKGGNL